MRIKLKITYDGTNYCGWQRQKNGISIQEVLETAINKLTGETVAVTASGRTDSGVHALGQVAHFDTSSAIPPQRFYLALNTVLPNDIKVIDSERVSEDFHSRYAAKKKTYRYSIYCSNVTLPLKDRFSEQVSEELDYEKMKEACKRFEGEHDFIGFASQDMSVKTTVRTIYSCKLVIKADENEFYIEVCGNGFLYNMVRIMCGAVLAVGKGEASTEDINKTLETGNRNQRFKTLSAKGLTLLTVEYS